MKLRPHSGKLQNPLVSPKKSSRGLLVLPERLPFSPVVPTPPATQHKAVAGLSSSARCHVPIAATEWKLRTIAQRAKPRSRLAFAHRLRRSPPCSLLVFLGSAPGGGDARSPSCRCRGGGGPGRARPLARSLRCLAAALLRLRRWPGRRCSLWSLCETKTLRVVRCIVRFSSQKSK
jgi:hypothetical protein